MIRWIWVAGSGLGKYILAPKWCLNVEGGSKFGETHFGTKMAPCWEGGADLSTEIVVTHDLYGSEFGETHFGALQ
jgi:hypothetical protein